MPIINVKLASSLPDKKTKDKVAKEIMDVMVRNLGKNPERIVVLFEDLPKDSFYFGAKDLESKD
ncbi:tautomerase family protein [Campylobacter sputorum]|uniref:tautomerase family protein n=1 Tax=Campylobacter sputorum TaxID=206 RepID=UPI00053BDD7B|nr:4-oxalocrotonate tautomerase family protein [Campylobacter sputorum]